MDKMSPEALAARIVEWHNRHPLARRIAAADLLSMGYVALPFRGGEVAPAAAAAAPPAAPPAAAQPAAEPPAGASLREKALARAQQPAAAPPAASAAAAPSAKVAAKSKPAAEAALTPAFTEDILPPLRPRRVAAWVARHGQELDAAPRDAPVRRVDADGGGLARLFYVLTAQIEADGRSRRVFVGAGDKPAVLGRRLWSRPRLVGAAVPLLLAVLGLAGWGLFGRAAAPDGLAAASAPASAAVAAPAAQPGPAAPPAFDAQGRPVDVEPQLGQVALPALRRPQSELHLAAPPAPVAPVLAPASAAVPVRAPEPASAPAARPPAAAAHSAPAAAAPAPPEAPQAAHPASHEAPGHEPGPGTKAPVAVAPAPPAATLAAAPVRPPSAAGLPPRGSFAVSTRLLRTRAESEQVMEAMQSLLDGMGAKGARVDVVPHGADWRVIGWPFARREDADRARALLASRGMRVEVLDF
ncbi:hypothetical protein [Rubrivivax sp. A210]|uniref:hypothetical protein n=1 Tax=Rubrivivax sp. A210 TaxID=2772301 RepID=UPI001919122A|nr:hypothetical protein [Rubrivivax sp. A210]